MDFCFYTHSSTFYFEPKANQWSHFEYSNGKLAKILEQEVPKSQNDIKLFSKLEEYQNLYFEGLYDYFGRLETSDRKILDISNDL